jgi:hypothetical protein
MPFSSTLELYSPFFARFFLWFELQTRPTRDGTPFPPRCR